MINPTYIVVRREERWPGDTCGKLYWDETFAGQDENDVIEEIMSGGARPVRGVLFIDPANGQSSDMTRMIANRVHDRLRKNYDTGKQVYDWAADFCEANGVEVPFRDAPEFDDRDWHKDPALDMPALIDPVLSGEK